MKVYNKHRVNLDCKKLNMNNHLIYNRTQTMFYATHNNYLEAIKQIRTVLSLYFLKDVFL